MSDIEAVLTSGQSLALGVLTDVAVSLAPPEHANAKCLNEDGTFSDLDVPVTDPFGNPSRQRPDLSMGPRLSEAYPTQLFGMLTVAKGGKTIAQLSKGGSTGKYEEMVAAVAASFSAAVALSKTFHVAAFHWVQGEADQAIHTGIGNYLLALDQLLSDYTADISTATGQGADWPLIMSQTAAWTVYKAAPQISLAQLEAARTRPRIYVVGGQYQLPYGVDPHLTGLGYYYLGELHARAETAIKNTGDWKPFAPQVDGIAIVDRTLIVTFDVPVQPLVLDTTLIPAAPNYGFTIGGSAASIVDVQLTGPDQVTISLDRAVTEGAATLGYGVNVAAKNRTGNLRDSDPSVSVHDGYPIPNWCCQFQDPIPTPVVPPTPFRKLFQVVGINFAAGGAWMPLYEPFPHSPGVVFGDGAFGDSIFL